VKRMVVNDVTGSGNVTLHFRDMELNIGLCEMSMMEPLEESASTRDGARREKGGIRNKPAIGIRGVGSWRRGVGVF
jgi:hypothetical protein